jgi:hypothetical protein
MKHLYIIFIILFIPILSFGQSEYFSTDSLTSFGIKLIDGGDLINSSLCQVKKGKETLVYTPYEVKEFGFKDGRVYISKDILITDSLQKVFLERLHKGNMTLYYYKGRSIKTFFIQKDSTLFVELPKQNSAKETYSSQLCTITNDCSNVSNACKLVSYNKHSMTKLISKYNECELKPFPHFSYGILIGYEFLKLVPSNNHNEYLTNFNFKYDGGFTFGVFIDNPILASDFSLHAELNFSKHGYSYNHTLESEDMDLIINTSSLRVPLLIRYTLPRNNFRPYIDAGAVFSYYINNENKLYQASISDSMIEISSQIEGSIISTSEFGYLFGCGLEFDLDYKKSIFYEIRFCRQFGAFDNILSKNSIINITSGINF